MAPTQSRRYLRKLTFARTVDQVSNSRCAMLPRHTETAAGVDAVNTLRVAQVLSRLLGVPDESLLDARLPATRDSSRGAGTSGWPAPATTSEMPKPRWVSWRRGCGPSRSTRRNPRSSQHCGSAPANWPRPSVPAGCCGCVTAWCCCPRLPLWRCGLWPVSTSHSPRAKRGRPLGPLDGSRFHGHVHRGQTQQAQSSRRSPGRFTRPARRSTRKPYYLIEPPPGS